IVPAYNPTPVYEIDTSMYMTLTDDENTFTFNRVKIDYGENESYSATVNGGVAESPTNTITISENPIFFKYKTTSYTKATGTYNPEGTYYLRKNGLYQKAQTPEEATFNAGDYYKRTVSSEDATSAQAIATGLKAFLTGMAFRGMNIRWRGDPLLKIGDRVELTNRAGGSIGTSVHHQILTYKNGLSADISCEIDTVAINAVYTGGGSPIIAIDGAALPGTDADTLGGHDSTYLATAEHAHDAEYLGLTAKAADADKLDGSHLSDVLLTIYPIGAVYISTVSTSPQTLFGGTWASIEGRFLLGADTTYTAGSTGGAATHTLTTGEIPSHSHVEQMYFDNLSVIRPLGAPPASTGTAKTMAASAAGSTPTTVSTQGEGGGEAHNNMPPYIAVYVWERTA
ncbi:MAG: hypothetical protein PHX74_12490, partial [Candidatus Sumerlaeales bacterium]|nr:hypothetical protein [Candidatus Sumerlaeales bacterium]